MPLPFPLGKSIEKALFDSGGYCTSVILSKNISSLVKKSKVKQAVFSFLLFAIFPIIALSQSPAWEHIYGGSGSVISAVIVSAKGTVIAASSTSGLYRLTSSGAWESSNQGLETSHLYSLYSASDSIIYAGTDIGAYRSSDDGFTWQRIEGDFPKAKTNAFLFTEFGSLFGALTGDGGLYRSDDTAKSWGTVNIGLSTTTVYSLAINSRRFIFSGTVSGIFRSANNGSNWTKITDDLIRYSEVRRIVVDPTDNLYAATDNGVLYSVSNGDSWQVKDFGIPTKNVLSLLRARNGYFYAGTDSGLYRSTNKGGTWERVESGLTTETVSSLASNLQGVLYAGTSTDVYQSTDNGANWKSLGIKQSSLSIYAMTATRNGLLYFCSDAGVYLSLNGGKNWERRSQISSPAYMFENDSLGYLYRFDYGLEYSADSGKTWQGRNALQIYALAFDNNWNMYAAGWASSGLVRATNNGEFQQFLKYNYVDTGTAVLTIDTEIYVGSISGGLHHTTTHRDTWDNTTVEVCRSRITGLALGKNGAVIASSLKEGLFRTVDKGALWTPIDQGLTDIRILDIASINENIYALTQSAGIYYSTNNGTSWKPLNTGIEGVTIAGIIASHNGYIYAYTSTGNIYRILDAEFASIDEKSVAPSRSFYLHQNYPNPFNPQTTIEFEINKPGRYWLKVYNSLGVVMQTIPDVYYTPGAYTHRFNAANLPSGVYYYQLSSLESSQIRPMVVAK